MKSIDMLSKSKRDTLIKVIVDEFAVHGFEQASTNRIAKESGISKGSLFNYLGSKKNQYYYVLKHELTIFQNRLQELMSEQPLPTDGFECLLYITKLKLRVALENPVSYKIMMDAVNDPSPDVKDFFKSEFASFSKDSIEHNRGLFSPGDLIHPDFHKALSDIVFFIISGYTTFLIQSQAQMNGQTEYDIESQFNQMSENLTNYFYALKTSFFK